MKRSKQKNPGVILGLLFALCVRISKVFRSGFIFRQLSSHKNDKEELASSAIYAGFGFVSRKCARVTENVKKITARQFERSFMLKLFSTVLTFLVNIPGRVIGAFGITWGAYVILINLIKRFALFSPDATAVNLLVGVIAFLSSLPLLFTDKSLCCMVRESRLVYAFLNKIFGVPDESMRTSKAKRAGQSGAVIFGIIFGLATYFISPLDIAVCALAFFLIALIMLYPEGGVLISISIAPLLGLVKNSSIVLAVFVLLTAFSYFLKVMRGKRVFRVGVTGLAVYAFMLVVFLSGFAPGEANTAENALLCCSLMLIFPLIVNLMTNKHWINACIAAFAVPSAVVAFIGFAQYFLGMSPSGWVDESLFSEITYRTVSVFNNPNILGAYLAAMFPIALLLTASRFDRKIRILGGITAAYIVIATVLTYSRSAWIALLAGAILYAVMISPKGIMWVVPAAAIAVALALIFPDTVGTRLVNFISTADSANNYRFAVWNSSWDLLSDSYLFGIGWGEEAFRTAYINYGVDGTQYAMHSHSLYMQIAIQTGVIGLVVFLISILSVVRKCFSVAFDYSSDGKLSLVAKASVSAVLAIMIAGVFDYTWYNFRVFFIFWALLALSCAAVNVCRKDENMWLVENDENYSYISVPIPSDNVMHTEN